MGSKNHGFPENCVSTEVRFPLRCVKNRWTSGEMIKRSICPQSKMREAELPHSTVPPA